MKIFRKLDSAVYLLAETPLSITSNNKNGCVALSFESNNWANNFIKQNPEALRSRGIDLENPRLVPVADSYEFMIHCARQGFAGISLLSENDHKEFIFCARLEETSSLLPTALVYYDQDKLKIKTKFKEYEESAFRTVKEWQRYDILDKVSRNFAVNQPFDISNRNNLFEIRTKRNGFLSLFKVTCRGNFNSPDGSIPFFTSLDLVFEFLNNSDYRSHLVVFEGFKTNFNDLAIDISESTEELKIVKIDNFKARLQELNNPFMGFVVNPNGTRDSTGYGTLGTGDPDFQPTFYGVSGSWKVLKDNTFEKIEDRNFWDGSDTFYWNGINSYKLMSLDRSFSVEAKSTPYSNIAEHDISDLIESTFSDREFELSETNQGEDLEIDKKVESYIIIWWDPVTGEGKEYPIYFKSFFDLLKWVWKCECSQDFPIRKEGAFQCNGLIGVVASPDIEQEKNIHNKMKLQLSKMFKKVALNGYSPKDSDDLSALINTYFKTLHIDLIGYCKDVLWQTVDDEQLELLELMEIPEDYVNELFKDSYKMIDPHGAEEGVLISGSETWYRLSDKAKYFIASSLSQLKLLGNSPQLDYSLVSIGFVKALEYELVLLFRDFCLKNDLEGIEYDSEDFGEKGLIEWAANKEHSKPPTLGGFGKLIKPNERNKNQLRQILGEYIDGLKCGEFLTKRKFWDKGINKITHKYRNGGAHDSAISRDVAIESLNFILGGDRNEGLLPKLVSWKTNIN
ncbi:hypothetical protein [Eudoraea adriatica]|uniref:hypothetical protein n=1 Tax=Eudoraea adriatica TaxID=446681 RepID=UPI00036EB123|nr:hypothetical protein [Eudoraea adriatica]